MLIAHISDLHFDKTTEWETNWQQLVDTLSRRHPRLIVITGDLVDHPTNDNFRGLSTHLKAMFEKLCQEAEKCRRQRPYIVSIPGNHDFSWWGNRVLPWGRLGRAYYKKSRFNRHIKSLLFPLNNYDELLADILKNTSIALYPINSCGGIFAQGKVHDVAGQLKKYDDIYKETCDRHSITYDTIQKIILLHHHPLPLPTPEHDEKKEGFLLLVNAHQLFEAAIKYGVKMIFHGHKHVGGASEFDLLGVGGNPVVVSACGSSSSSKEQDREVKFVEISPHGSVSGYSFIAAGAGSVFHESGKKIELLPYAEIRSEKSKKHHLYTGTKNSSILKIGTITKTVDIQKSGSAIISNNYEHIKFSGNTDKSSCQIEEFIRADAGRVPIIGFSYSTCPTDMAKSRLLKVDEYRQARSDSPESFLVRYEPSVDFYHGDNACCQVQYPLLNGYALTTNEYEEMYPSPKEKRHTEVVSFRARYPTDQIKIVVKFPSNDYFPNPEEIELHAAIQPTETIDTTLNILFEEYEKNSDEASYLHNGHMGNRSICALTGMNQIIVIVEKPQPDLTYILRWGLPNGGPLALLDPRENRILEEFRRIFSGNSHYDKVDEFYQVVSKDIRSALSDDNLGFILYGYNESRRQLIVLRGPTKFGQPNGLCVGRGASGKAFRMRSAEFYERKELTRDDLIGNIINRLEPVYNGFNPVAILSIPMMYPRILDEVWINKDLTGQSGICPVIGVLAIYSENESSLTKFGDGISEHSGDMCKIFPEVELDDENNGERFTEAQRTVAVSRIHRIISDGFQKIFFNELNRKAA